MAGLNEILTWEKLSQVWFVLDYVQLEFQDGKGISVYNPFTVELNNDRFNQGEFGYADTLVKAIGSTVTDVEYLRGAMFALSFSNGLRFEVDLTPGIRSWAEAFELGLSNGPYIEFAT